jgi:hypothetical protein
MVMSRIYNGMKFLPMLGRLELPYLWDLEESSALSVFYDDVMSPSIYKVHMRPRILLLREM